ncbi:kinase-like domain-containing protein [Scenedesmus sp. NREL 46B-D3]|nr:kinase-like domain-containing protein [Scenedesmus sp. NREL 46B-D3]
MPYPLAVMACSSASSGRSCKHRSSGSNEWQTSVQALLQHLPVPASTAAATLTAAATAAVAATTAVMTAAAAAAAAAVALAARVFSPTIAAAAAATAECDPPAASPRWSGSPVATAHAGSLLLGVAFSASRTLPARVGPAGYSALWMSGAVPYLVYGLIREANEAGIVMQLARGGSQRAAARQLHDDASLISLTDQAIHLQPASGTSVEQLSDAEVQDPQMQLRLMQAELQAKRMFSVLTSMCTTSAACSASMPLGMEALHAADVVHMDVKTENILLATELQAGCTPTAMVGDLGLAKLFRGPGGADQRKDEKVDVYAFGVFLWHVSTGCKDYPFADMNTPKAPPHVPAWLAQQQPDLVRLMEDCWEELPCNRPTFAQVVDTLAFVVQDVEERLVAAAAPPPPAAAAAAEPQQHRRRQRR